MAHGPAVPSCARRRSAPARRRSSRGQETGWRLTGRRALSRRCLSCSLPWSDGQHGAGFRPIRSPGPLKAFGERVRARRGAQVAAVAVARKLVVLCWHLLTKDQDYAFARPSLTRQKTRRLELTAGASRRPRRHDGATLSPTAAQRAAERELQTQAELAYRRLVDDWRSTAAPKGGAGATPGRASQKPVKGKAARQATSP